MAHLVLGLGNPGQQPQHLLREAAQQPQQDTLEYAIHRRVLVADARHELGDGRVELVRGQLVAQLADNVVELGQALLRRLCHAAHATLLPLAKVQPQRQ